LTEVRSTPGIAVSPKRADPKNKRAPSGAADSTWDGRERRKPADRRSGARRLDERRRAGIGEIIDDRRERAGRRRSDRRDKPKRRGPNPAK
jgi:hypothetical protein